MAEETIWQPAYHRKDLKILEAPCAYDGYLKVEQCKVQYQLFSGGWSQTFPRELIRHGLSCAALLYDPEQDRLVMVEQARMGAIDEPISPWLIEPVAGMVDKGETPEQTVYREAKEESGCDVLDLIYATEFLVSPGISTERTKIYCARVKAPALESVHGLSQEGEDIKVHVLPVKSALKLLDTLPTLSATTLISLQWFALNQASIKEKWLG